MLKKLMAALAGVAAATSLVMMGQAAKAQNCYDEFTVYNYTGSNMSVELYMDNQYVGSHYVGSRQYTTIWTDGCGDWKMVYDEITGSRKKLVHISLNGYLTWVEFTAERGLVYYDIGYE